MSDAEIKHSCLRLLARREHSQQELLRKLQAKGFIKEAIEAVLVELNQQGLQSETRFAESYARMRFGNGFGSLKIDYELKQRGIENFDLEAVLSENFMDEQQLINTAYQKKYPHTEKLAFKEQLKRQRFLQQRGFSYDLIQQLFKHLKNIGDADELAGSL